MGLREDLIAAKALIDTAEKARDPMDTWFAAHGVDDIMNFCEALDAAVPTDYRNPSFGLRKYYVFCSDQTTTLADVQALFDRAIEAAA